MLVWWWCLSALLRACRHNTPRHSLGSQGRLSVRPCKLCVGPGRGPLPRVCCAGLRREKVTVAALLFSWLALGEFFFGGRWGVAGWRPGVRVLCVSVCCVTNALLAAGVRPIRCLPLLPHFCRCCCPSWQAAAAGPWTGAVLQHTRPLCMQRVHHLLGVATAGTSQCCCGTHSRVLLQCWLCWLCVTLTVGVLPPFPACFPPW